MSRVDLASASVVAEGLRKTFEAPGGGLLHAVDGISLQVRPGELTALVGPDGAGKTTLLRMMAGLLKPAAGTLRVLGIDVAQDPQTVQDRISYMPQRFGLYEDLSVQENLDLYADLHGVPQAVRRERFARMLEMTDMARFTARPAGKLSGGMKQKLGLACTLVRSPDLLLLDEPSVGVDPLSRRDLWKIVQQLVDDEKLSVIVSTAYMDEAERCAQVFVMHQGRLLAEGAPGALRERARGLTYVATPPTGTPARDLQARLIDAQPLIIDAVPKGGAVWFIRQPKADAHALDALLDGIACQPRPEELEDAFMMMLRQQQTQEAGTVPETPAPSPQSPLKGREAGHKDQPVIVVRDLVRKFGDFTAVARTSFDVARGEIFGLLGPNGAGKTTTFRMLCGLLPASSGHLEVAGMNLRHARAQARARIGYVSQKFALYGNLSVRENLEFFGGAYGLRGQALRTRVEATLAQAGVTVIITTHFMEEAEYCDRIAIQDAGKMLALGTPQAVREQAGRENTEGGADMNSAFIAIVEHGRAADRAQNPGGGA